MRTGNEMAMLTEDGMVPRSGWMNIFVAGLTQHVIRLRDAFSSPASLPQESTIYPQSHFDTLKVHK